MNKPVPGLVIRQTELADLNSIYRLGLVEPVFSSIGGWEPSALADAFCRSELISYTAARKKEIMGFIIGRIHGEATEILWLMIKEKYRKKGIANALLDNFLKKSKERGAAYFSLTLPPGKTEMEKLFNKRNIEQYENYIKLTGTLR